MCAQIAGGGNALARKASIPRGSLENYLKGLREPKASALAKIALGAEVNAHWLLTGEGPMQIDVDEQHQMQDHPPASAGTQPAQIAAPELVALITDAIQRTYKDAGARLPALDLGRLTAEKYNEILAAGIEPDEWSGAVKLMAGQLRRDLAASTNDPASRKRAAS